MSTNALRRRRRPGPPAGLTPAVHREIVRLLRAGNFVRTTAAAVGLDSDTVHRWVKLGREEANRRAAGKPGDPDLEPFVRFSADVRKALATAEADAVGRITDAGKTDWRAAAAYLERRHPKRWGQKVRFYVEQELSAFLDVLEARLDPETFTRIVRAAGEATAAIAESGEEDPGEIAAFRVQ